MIPYPLRFPSVAAAVTGVVALALMSSGCAHTTKPPAPPSPADIPSERLSVGAPSSPKTIEPLLLLDVVDSEKSGKNALKGKEGRFFFALRDAERVGTRPRNQPGDRGRDPGQGHRGPEECDR